MRLVPFQLAAVAVVLRLAGENRRSAGVAGLLAGLALLAKLNAVLGLAATAVTLR